MMKKILTGLALAAAGVLCAQENAIGNGSFEQILKKQKSDSYIMGQVRGGWDFGKGPIAKFPESWVANHGKIKSSVVTVGENGENKENVTDGKNSMHFVGERFSIYNSKRLRPGKYKLTFKYKGSGRISFASYNYYDDAKKKTNNLGPRPLVSVLAKDQWQTYSGEVTIGKWNPTINRCLLAINGNKVDVYIDEVSMIPVEVD